MIYFFIFSIVFYSSWFFIWDYRKLNCNAVIDFYYNSILLFSTIKLLYCFLYSIFNFFSSLILSSVRISSRETTLKSFNSLLAFIISVLSFYFYELNWLMKNWYCYFWMVNYFAKASLFLLISSSCLVRSPICSFKSNIFASCYLIFDANSPSFDFRLSTLLAREFNYTFNPFCFFICSSRPAIKLFWS